MELKREELGDWLVANRELTLLVSIIVLAALFRLWQLPSLPYGLHPEEAANGLDAISILQGDIQPFYESAGGREGLLFYLQALSVAIFGPTMFALRLMPALAGIGAVFMIYLAGRVWFSRRVGLMAAFFMAISPWAIHMSRLALPAALLLLLVPTILWLSARALQTNRAGWFVATGVAIGLGFYVQPSWHVLPLALAPLLLFSRYFYRSQLRQLWQPLLIVLLSVLVTLLPFAAYMATNSSAYFERPTTSVFNAEQRDEPLAQVLVESVGRTAGMFHIAGDRNQLHNLRGEPQLTALVGVLFLLGLLLSWRRRHDIRYTALVSLLAVLLLPAALSMGNVAPSALRAVAAAPIIYILAAIGLSELIARWRGVFPRNPLALHLAITIIVAAGAITTIYSYQRYFVAWANAPQTFTASYEPMRAVAEFMLTHDIDGTYFVVASEYQVLSVSFLTDGKVEYIQVSPPDAGEVELAVGDRLIVPYLNREQDIELGAAALDQVTQISRYRSDTALFTLYRVEE